MARHRAPHGRPRSRAAVSSNHDPRADDLDQRRALHGADQRDAAPRQQPLLIGHAGVEIPRRPPQQRRRADRAAARATRSTRLGRQRRPSRVSDTPPAAGSGHAPSQTRSTCMRSAAPASVGVASASSRPSISIGVSCRERRRRLDGKSAEPLLEQLPQRRMQRAIAARRLPINAHTGSERDQRRAIAPASALPRAAAANATIAAAARRSHGARPRAMRDRETRRRRRRRRRQWRERGRVDMPRPAANDGACAIQRGNRGSTPDVAETATSSRRHACNRCAPGRHSVTRLLTRRRRRRSSPAARARRALRSSARESLRARRRRR